MDSFFCSNFKRISSFKFPPREPPRTLIFIYKYQRFGRFPGEIFFGSRRTYNSESNYFFLPKYILACVIFFRRADFLSVGHLFGFDKAFFSATSLPRSFLNLILVALFIRKSLKFSRYFFLEYIKKRASLLFIFGLGRFFSSIYIIPSVV